MLIHLEFFEIAWKPLKSPAWEFILGEIFLTLRLNFLSFSFSALLYPSHPSVPRWIHPAIPSSISQACVFTSPQMLKIPPSLFFPPLFLFLLYLITAIPLGVSLILFSLLFLFLHQCSQSHSLPHSFTRFISLFYPLEISLPKPPSGCFCPF